MSGGDPEAELVRHFLIETTSRGVRLKGCNNEPVFGELNVSIVVYMFVVLISLCLVRQRFKLTLRTCTGTCTGRLLNF